ncbi:NUDIX domain-containing protein [Jeotgalibaca caeni]|uniref:NUDIX domain-containing protein n=1 Tax=Jeotgalibaca caeni TaxID=3028623 RepID=UPI00237DD5F8|nr:NUDIX hydrolase [Jeotgalibaca caeni]MDE1547920.1 NUDIX hydrolase [Jeotgalibaca caeni]
MVETSAERTRKGEMRVMEFEEKTLTTEVIFDGVLVHLEREEVELPNGKTAIREIIRHPGAVAIIPFTKDGEMILVRQFRKPLDRTIVEIPAGKLDAEDADGLTAAKRELEEETHYQAESWEELVTMYPTPAYLDEKFTIYVAEGLTEVAEPLAGDDDEFVEVLTCTYEEAMALQQSGEICDAKTLYAMLYWKNRLAEKE